tara:strand:- start:7158 stop:7685 length:528 start_codon:yes stop_codon:yes gene_type:complete
MIIVKDNLIPQELQDYYHTLVFGSTKINATLPLVCKYEPTAFDGGNIPVSFEHVLKSSTKLTEHYGNFSKIPQTVFAELNIDFIDIIAARLFITVPHKTKLDFYAPHTDRPEKHLGLIYYVNDSDGDTVFFEKEKVIEKVTPKKGRIVLFDGETLHSGGFPTDNPRCIVNFNIYA